MGANGVLVFNADVKRFLVRSSFKSGKFFSRPCSHVGYPKVLRA